MPFSVKLDWPGGFCTAVFVRTCKSPPLFLFFSFGKFLLLNFPESAREDTLRFVPNPQLSSSQPPKMSVATRPDGAEISDYADAGVF